MQQPKDTPTFKAPSVPPTTPTVVTPTVRVTPTGSLCMKTGVKAGLGFSGIFFGGYYYG